MSEYKTKNLKLKVSKTLNDIYNIYVHTDIEVCFSCIFI